MNEWEAEVVLECTLLDIQIIKVYFVILPQREHSLRQIASLCLSSFLISQMSMCCPCPIVADENKRAWKNKESPFPPLSRISLRKGNGIAIEYEQAF